jgi:UDP-N-acetylglucosamine acyltransferase
MIGGLTGARGDVIPFGYVLGQLATLVGLNVVGLKRLGYSRSDMHRLRRAYRMLFDTEVNFDERVSAVMGEFADDPLVGKVVAFLRANGKRPLTQPAHPRHAAAHDNNGHS